MIFEFSNEVPGFYMHTLEGVFSSVTAWLDGKDGTISSGKSSNLKRGEFSFYG